MDLQEYNKRLQELAATATQKALQSIVVPAGFNLLATIKNRIIRKGQNSNGGQMGTYSTKPAYYSRKQFIQKGAFKPQGKNQIFNADGSRKKKITRDKNRRTMYLPNGYKELRAIQGRETGFVNAEYSGDTMLAYQGEPKESSMLLGFTKEKQSKIRKGLEKKYGQFWQAQKTEMAEYSKEVTEQSIKLTQKILSGA